MRAFIYLTFGIACILASAAFGYAYVHWIGFLPDMWWAGACVATGVAGAFSVLGGLFTITDDGADRGYGYGD